MKMNFAKIRETWNGISLPGGLGPQQKKAAPYAEILLSFLIIDCVNYLFYRGDPGFLKFPLSPYWLVVLLAASRYGFLPGFLAGLLATFHVFLALFKGLPTRMAVEKLLESQGLVLPVALFFAGIFLGEIRQKYIKEELEGKQRLAEKEKAVEGLRGRLDLSDKARSVLEARIVEETTTVRTLYEIAVKFDTLSLSEVYQGCLDMMREHLWVEEASLYVEEGNYLVLKAAAGKDPEHMVEGKLLKSKTLMSLALKENRFLTVKDILAIPESNRFLEDYNQVLAMAPLRNEKGEAVGIVNVEKMDFINFHKANLQLIELVADWTGKAMQNIRFYEDARGKQIFDEEYGIYCFSYFEHVFPSEFRRARKFRLDLSVLVLKLEKFGFFPEAVQKIIFRTVVALLRRSLADTDMLFRYRYDGTFAVIRPFGKMAESDEILKRVRREFSKTVEKGAGPSLEPELAGASSEINPSMERAEDLMAPALVACGLKAPVQ